MTHDPIGYVRKGSAQCSWGPQPQCSGHVTWRVISRAKLETSFRSEPKRWQVRQRKVWSTHYTLEQKLWYTYDICWEHKLGGTVNPKEDWNIMQRKLDSSRNRLQCKRK